MEDVMRRVFLLYNHDPYLSLDIYYEIGKIVYDLEEEERIKERAQRMLDNGKRHLEVPEEDFDKLKYALYECSRKSKFVIDINIICDSCGSVSFYIKYL